MISDATWQEFINHAVAIQQLSETTIIETIRKLKHLEKNGINLMAQKNDLEKQVYAFFAKKLRQGSSYSALNHYVRALNRWCKFRQLDLKFKRYKEHHPPRRIPLTGDIKDC